MAKPFPASTYLFSFRDGSYKTVTFKSYKHNQWIMMEKEDGAKVFINPDNVNYIEEVLKND